MPGGLEKLVEAVECAQEVETGGNNMEFESLEEGQRRQAWNIVGLILHVGRPASPLELAELSKGVLEKDEIEAIARMKGTPIRLSVQGYVHLVRGQVKSRFDTCARISKANAPWSGKKQGLQDADKENVASLKKTTEISRSGAKFLQPTSAPAVGFLPVQKRIATEDSNVSTWSAVPVFSAYDVVGEGTAGGYGTVYKVRRKTDGRIFAMKCPLEKTPESHINNEICMLHKFRGERFIVQCDSVVHNGKARANIVMQYINHEEPKVLKNDITLCELRAFAFCLFNALGRVHVKGVAHRDIKPSNFLFCRESKLGCLIDFNLALDCSRRGNSRKPLRCLGKAVDENKLSTLEGNRPLKRKRDLDERLAPPTSRSQLGPYAGTKGYRAPEVLLRSMHQTPKVDVWAAGVTLMNLIVGRNIFAANNAHQALREIARMRGVEELVALAQAHGRPIAKEVLEVRCMKHSLQHLCMLTSKKDVKVKNKWPPSLFDLLEKCLQIDPSKRIDADTAAQHEFFDA